jgi:hypothetical protein
MEQGEQRPRDLHRANPGIGSDAHRAIATSRHGVENARELGVFHGATSLG